MAISTSRSAIDRVEISGKYDLSIVWGRKLLLSQYPIDGRSQVLGLMIRFHIDLAVLAAKSRLHYDGDHVHASPAPISLVMSPII